MWDLRRFTEREIAWLVHVIRAQGPPGSVCARAVTPAFSPPDEHHARTAHAAVLLRHRPGHGDRASEGFVLNERGFLGAIQVSCCAFHFFFLIYVRVPPPILRTDMV